MVCYCYILYNEVSLSCTLPFFSAPVLRHFDYKYARKCMV